MTGEVDPATLGAAYSLIGELLARSERPDEEQFGADVAAALRGPSTGELRERLAGAPLEVTGAIDAFLASEPSPRARSFPLYLGAYLFEEPTATDRADPRNGYLLEMLNLYWHFGLDPRGGQPPDYLPMMLDFAGESVSRTDAPQAPVARRYFIEHHLSPGLAAFREVLERHAEPRAQLLRAAEALAAIDLVQTAHLVVEEPAPPARKAGARSLPLVKEP